ncbi:HAUS augmin-like complex subunit 6 [Polymixia lowei]
MANPVTLSLQKTNGKHLWFALLGLGFQPDAAESMCAGRTNVKRINLGMNMFDRPNKDAFYIVTHFLLEKLNPTRFHEAYGHFWPVVNPKADAEFRKVTCAWLREIMDENGTGPKVVASLFLSPGGPKFINLMLHLANHVMLQEMKTFTTDGSWVPEAAATPASSLDMAMKRFKLTKTRFLKSAVKEDHLLQEYQRRAQSVVKSVREIRAEGAKYDDLLKRHAGDIAQDRGSLAQKIQGVRTLWSAIDGMLSTIKEQRRVVECVMKGEVDQYTLDGTDLALKIPRVLLERIEQLPQHMSAGNVYKEGHLNLLCVLELMNHALQLVKEERSGVGAQAPMSQLHPQHLQDKSQQMARVLEDLQLIRLKISKEEVPEVRNFIRKLEVEWDRKWMETLKDAPLTSFLNDDPALGFLSPMAPLSFEPATEATCRSGVFSLYPAKLLEEKPVQTESQECISTIGTNLKSYCPTPAERAETPVATTEVLSQANNSLCELLDTPCPPARTPSPPPPLHQASVRKMAHAHPNVAVTKNKAQILDWECDNLANQFADAVTTTSPVDCRIRGLDLGGLLSTLGGDPFSTKKQLPRTPESLIMDVKSSWRKAVEESQTQKTRQSATFNGDGIPGWLTPLGEEGPLSPDAPSQSISCSPTSAATCHSSPSAPKQGASLMSTLFWDESNAEFLHGQSDSGAVLFCVDETLPEMLGNDSLINLSDEAPDTSSASEEQELLLPHIPSLTSDDKRTPLAARQRLEQIQQACSDASFMDNRKRIPECLLSPRNVTGLDRDWLMAATETAASNATSDKVFSLGLDTLRSPSPPNKQEYSLPKLITFSPIDDM